MTKGETLQLNILSTNLKLNLNAILEANDDRNPIPGVLRLNDLDGQLRVSVAPVLIAGKCTHNGQSQRR